MSAMEVQKRKRDDDGETNGKRGKPREDDGGLKRVAPPQPADEEVEEFFAIMKRIQVAVKYFQRRNGVNFTDGDLTAKAPWNPSFQREDFVAVKKDDPVCSEENRAADLDLNSDPVSDVADRV